MELDIVYITGACEVDFCNLPSRFMSVIFLWSDDIYLFPTKYQTSMCFKQILEINGLNKKWLHLTENIRYMCREKTGCFYILKGELIEVGI